MNDLEQLEGKVRQDGTLIERLKKCSRMIGSMCKERRPPRMTIPVQWSDEDFFMNRTIVDAVKALEPIGTIYSSDSLILRIYVGEAKDENGVYDLTAAMDQTPLVESKQTGKYFSLSWTDIINLAINAGVDDPGEVGTSEEEE